ncbi:ferritin subunit isoform X2 [Drosophila albomicans]|uniref:Ferritin n=1 Tax=Drosophila albomicans TaxID=7291 RepID=A0A6P8XMN4_DROAB|nr:ferritin subunit isoform X2 [Drosophila albomicans]XP_051862460.1 ferritin subunit isoform X2 [Drosophila albomicans]
MVKLIASIASLLVVLALANVAQADSLKCNIKSNAAFSGWPDMKAPCINSMRKQIQKEIFASTQYLAMAAHFATDTVNRPGFAEHFIKAAKEEREHGAKLVEYLSMRGQLTDTVNNLIKVPTVDVSKWTGLSALEAAFKLETEVTNSIRALIKTCEGTAKNGEDNDYHLVDYLTGVYLEEQLTGQRDLAGKITTLEKMMDSHGELGEFLFDKNL